MFFFKKRNRFTIQRLFYRRYPLQLIMETVGLEKHELPPTNQKRMVAFINHFILTTVSFLNQFAADCESKLIAHEHKMQSLEASLLIVEAKLASIEALNNDPSSASSEQVPASEETASNNKIVVENDIKEEPSGRHTLERDPRYEKFFKLIQVGVPILAVKDKISREGLDPDYLDRFL